MWKEFKELKSWKSKWALELAKRVAFLEEKCAHQEQDMKARGSNEMGQRPQNNVAIKYRRELAEEKKRNSKLSKS